MSPVTLLVKCIQQRRTRECNDGASKLQQLGYLD